MADYPPMLTGIPDSELDALVRWVLERDTRSFTRNPYAMLPPTYSVPMTQSAIESIPAMVSRMNREKKLELAARALQSMDTNSLMSVAPVAGQQKQQIEQMQAAQQAAPQGIPEGMAGRYGMMPQQQLGAQPQMQAQQASQPSLGMGDLRALEQQTPGVAQPTTGRFAGMTVNELLAWQQAHAGELFDPTDPTGESLTPLGIEYFTALQAAQGLVGGQGGTGGGGGGGYDNSLGWAQLAEQQRQNEWARQFEMEREKQRILEAQRNLRMTGADIQSSAAARAMDLAGQLAPSAIVPGQQYIYGFEPGGIASQIAQRAGLPFTPRPAVGTQIDTGIGPRMAADLVAKAQQAGG